MRQISPVGIVRKERKVAIVKKPNGVKEKRRTYEEYIMAECLKGEVDIQKYASEFKDVRKGDKIYSFDDNKTPLCGGAGVALVRNNAVVDMQFHLCY